MTRINTPQAREPVEATPRKGISPAQRLRVWEHQKGLCEACGEPVHLLDMEVDHRVAIALGGLHGFDNFQGMHAACHRAKTSRDVRAIAKARRLRRASDPQTRKAKRPRGGRGFDRSKRKKLSGEVVER